MGSKRSIPNPRERGVPTCEARIAPRAARKPGGIQESCDPLVAVHRAVLEAQLEVKRPATRVNTAPR